ncbi:interleukin-21 receptor isoform X2 [Paroedura picta]
MRGQAILLLLFLQHSKSDPHTACKNLRCFADYVRTLTCLWEIGPDALRGNLPNITATWGGGHGGTCTFHPTFRNTSHMRYMCSSEQKPCIFGQTFVVTIMVLVNGGRAVHQECQPFQCHENIKLRAPFNVTAAACPGGYNISWESGYVANDYLHGELQYQLRYRQKVHTWSPTEGGMAGVLKPVLQDTPTLWLLAQELEGNVEYELQVRARPRDHSAYQGTWSDWSPTSSLRTSPRGTAGAAWVVTPLLAFSLMVTLVTFLCKHHRRWKKLDPFIPSPAPFFQSLYLAHNGDFKKWVGTSCSGATLAVHECATALPEVCRISRKRPLATTAPGETSAALCTAALPSFTNEQPGSILEHAYGHLSIDTVTVADTCGLETEDYRCLPLHSDHMESHIALFRETPPSPSKDSGSSGPWHPDTCLAWLQATASLEHGGPVSTSSPPSTEPLCRKPLSSFWLAEVDLGEGLDLDTMDSGFVDSDCSSPEDCKFQGRCTSHTAPGKEDGPASLPSYVKQWVAGHLPLTEHR